MKNKRYFSVSSHSPPSSKQSRLLSRRSSAVGRKLAICFAVSGEVIESEAAVRDNCPAAAFDEASCPAAARLAASNKKRIDSMRCFANPPNGFTQGWRRCHPPLKHSFNFEVGVRPGL